MADSISEKLGKKEYLSAWRQFKDEHPTAYTAAAVLPVTGQMAAVADYTDAMDKNDSTDGVTAAASFIPGVKLAKMASKMAPSVLRSPSSMTRLERSIEPLVNKAPTIGKAAGAEQVGQYVENKLDEYSKAWKGDKKAPEAGDKDAKKAPRERGGES